LHALWDSVLYEYDNDLTLPLSPSDWTYLGEQSSRLTTLYPDSAFDNLEDSYKTWNADSLALAESFVYEGIEEKTIPSDEYIQAGI
jgi:hypothetical protein